MKKSLVKINLLLALLALSLTLSDVSTIQAQRPTPTPRQKKRPAPTISFGTTTPPFIIDAPPEINFTVGMTKPWTHMLEVEMRLRQNIPAQLELVMPVWTPGSYLVREYARHVQDFSVKTSGGQNLQWEKINKNTWRINTAGANGVVVSYRVYANELTVRTNELNDRHAFFTPAALLMHPRGQINAPSVVRVVPYGNWKIATGLPAVAGQPNTFSAANFDILYDSPFEVSNFREFSFTAKGKPHRFVIDGEGNYDQTRLERDVPKIVEASAALFGDELPYDNYLFILNLRGGGGLEHLNSTALQWNRFGFKPDAQYEAFLELVAHEFYHLWNVKRIRPDALGPFDYENENYTKLLWVAEGTTSYYESIILQRAGFVSDKEYLAARAAQIADLQRRPGRFQTSVEEASFDAWIKYYRQDENSINNQISYYDKGAIVSMMLDLAIRRASNGAKSLDDAMRYLYNEHFKRGRNYTPEDFQRAAELQAGTSLNDFFTKYVRGREEIDYNSIFADFGIRLETTTGAPQAAYLGANFTAQGERLNVTQIPAGTPAYEQGLNTGDQIVAVDGLRATNPQFVNNYIAEKRPGDKIRLTVFRFDELRDIEITLAGRAPEQYRFVAVQNPTAEQRRLYQGWLGAEPK